MSKYIKTLELIIKSASVSNTSMCTISKANRTLKPNNTRPCAVAINGIFNNEIPCTNCAFMEFNQKDSVKFIKENSRDKDE